MRTLSDKKFAKNYKFAGKRYLYFEEDIKESIEILKKEILKRKYSVLTKNKLYEIIDKIFGDALSGGEE